MNNTETYMSLYEYTGRAGNAENGLGRRVNQSAHDQKIDIKYRDIPVPAQKDSFKSVCTYPVSFLNEYFKQNPTELPDNSAFVRRSELIKVLQRIDELESNINILTNLIDKIQNATNKHDSSNDDDELPF
jgi:hypothetical protein